MRNYKEQSTSRYFILCVLGISCLETVQSQSFHISLTQGEVKQSPGLMKDIWLNIWWEMVLVWQKQDYTTHDDLSKEK